MNNRNHIIFSLIVSCMFTLFSCHSENKGRAELRIGNKQYNKQAFNDAESSYLKSIEKGSSTEALYGRGNTTQRLLLSAPSDKLESMDSVALSTYKSALELSVGNNYKKSKIYHNMGDLCYTAGIRNKKLQRIADANKYFEESIDYFKSSLRLNPKDDETRYNLAMAEYMLEKNREENNNQDNQNQDNQNQDKQNQDKQNQDNQNQDKQNQDKQNQNNQNQDNQNQDNQKDNQNNSQDQDKNQENGNKNKEDKKQEPENNEGKNGNSPKSEQQQNNPSSRDNSEFKVNGKIDEKTANQLLNAAQQDENKVQKKIEKAIMGSGSYEKDW